MFDKFSKEAEGKELSAKGVEDIRKELQELDKA